MIYWINGSYGVGKTTIAEALVKKLKKAYIFDPEAVGNAVRDNHPQELIFSYIFEDYELWRKFNYGETNPVIANWMRKVDTLEYLKLWEQINNTNFKPTDFEGFKSKPGENAFTISPKKWIELTNAIGIRVKSGKNGGTFAHRDIALEFASWISAEVKL